jgi:hypothetical protein
VEGVGINQPSRPTNGAARNESDTTMLDHLKRSVIAAAAVLAVSLTGSTAPASAAGSWDYLLPPYGACGTAAEGDMSKTYSQWTTGAMCLVNAARNNAGLRSYSTSMFMVDSAYKKATDISVCQPDPNNGTAVHNACGRPIDYYMRWGRPCAGYGYAENVNIAAGARSTARAAVSAWLNSDGHRAQLLSTQHTDHGVMYSGPTTYPGRGPDTRIWVHHMGYCL